MPKAAVTSQSKTPTMPGSSLSSGLPQCASWLPSWQTALFFMVCCHSPPWLLSPGEMPTSLRLCKQPRQLLCSCGLFLQPCEGADTSLLSWQAFFGLTQRNCFRLANVWETHGVQYVFQIVVCFILANLEMSSVVACVWIGHIYIYFFQEYLSTCIWWISTFALVSITISKSG